MLQIFSFLLCFLLATSATALPTLAGCQLFPANNVWNTPIDTLPVHSLSAKYVNAIGTSRGLHPDFGSYLLYGIPYTVVTTGQAKVPVSFDYASESDPGPYPIPKTALIEGGANSTGDRHILLVDNSTCKLYELYSAYPQSDGSWKAGSGAIFNLTSNNLRPATWTSADAAGLPILPGLIRYDEVAAGVIEHAIRFTTPQTQKAYVWPGRHYASSLTDTQYPPMGQRFRLKASFNVSSFTRNVQVVLNALKKFGIILADNGSPWFLSGVSDTRWNDDEMHVLGTVLGSNFEAVDESGLMVDANSGQVSSSSATTTAATTAKATTPTTPKATTTTTTTKATTTTVKQTSTTTKLATTTTKVTSTTKGTVTTTAKQTTQNVPMLAGCQIFPSNNIWNTPIDTLPVHSLSAKYVNSIGSSRGLHPDFGSYLLYGIPYTVVTTGQAKVPVSFDYADESDAGPYPIPKNALIEAGANSTGDRHVLVLDNSTCKLYELYSAYPQSDGSWKAGSGAIFNLTSNNLRPATWTSADAAGLPILPGLIRYDEVAAGVIQHAIRFTTTQTQKAYVWPARHYASSLTDTQYPPMGQRFRLKASFNVTSFTRNVQVVLTALKKYGIILADNGSPWFLSGVSDTRWNDDEMHVLGTVLGSNFEAVDESGLMADANSGQTK